MKKVLIIEDEPSVLENVIELLEGIYEVRGAKNGMLGVSIAKEFLPDLIICDIMMPELDGYGVLKEIQNDIKTSTIPFIFLTAKSELSDLRQGMELGADDYLTKPFLPEELFRTIEIRLKKSAEFASKSEKVIQELTLNIASTLPHELRTPLNGIMASSQILMDYYDSMDNVEIQQLHENIFNSAKRLHELIVRYLAFSNIELLFFDNAHRENLLRACEEVDVFTHLSKSILKIAKDNGRLNDIESSLTETTVNIHIDHVYLIADELISNACKFSEKGSKIIVSSNVIDDIFSLTVQDFGRGMNEAQINQIGAYRQFDRKIYEQQGSGLGLITVKRLAQIYNGKLIIDSQPLQFTKATFSLPVRQKID